MFLSTAYRKLLIVCNHNFYDYYVMTAVEFKDMIQKSLNVDVLIIREFTRIR